MSDCTGIPTLDDIETSKKNMGTIDEVVTSKSDYTSPATDGENKLTLEGLGKKFGFVIAGDFATGFTIESRNQVGQAADGTIWRYTGVLPFTVPAGTVPTPPTYEQLFDTDHDLLTNLDGRGHGAIHRINTTVSEVATGKYQVGDKLTLTDRGGAKFNVVNGGTANGFDIIDAGGGNTAELQKNAVYNPLHWGCKTDGSDSSAAFQAMLDDIPQYSTDTQNSGAFQIPVQIHLDESYYFSAPVKKFYRNNMHIIGTGSMIARSGFAGGDYLLELIACSHLVLDGFTMDGVSYYAKSAIRASGDGFTGTKRNSTNILFSRLFFRNFGATGTNGYVVDTLSPNGIAGDYSIDDSSFEHCNFLGSFGGGIRLASSEIKITGGKFSFIGADEVNPVINLGNGSSVVMKGVVFTTCAATHIKADDGASIGRVLLSGCYNETTTAPMYSQTGGTCRSLEIDGGYFSAPTDSGATFILFNGACKAQLKMTGAAFQRNGYEWIDLGDSGSLVGDQQTSTTSWNSFYPKIKNGCFKSDGMFIQTTQDANKKRFVEAKYDQICDTKLQLFVGAEDDLTRLRFLTLQDALKYVDQSGYTECEIQVPAGTHIVNQPHVIAGDVVIQGAGAATTIIELSANIVSRNANLAINSVTLDHGNRLIKNRSGTLTLTNCVLNASVAGYLVDHLSGTTTLSSCTFAGESLGVGLSTVPVSTGEIYIVSPVFTNIDAQVSSASTASCRVKYLSSAIPTQGTWQQGTIQEDGLPNSGATMQRICTVTGNPGTWRSTITVG